jgi:hypothetical protein
MSRCEPRSRSPAAPEYLPILALNVRRRGCSRTQQPQSGSIFSDGPLGAIDRENLGPILWLFPVSSQAVAGGPQRDRSCSNRYSAKSPVRQIALRPGASPSQNRTFRTAPFFPTQGGRARPAALRTPAHLGSRHAPAAMRLAARECWFLKTAMVDGRGICQKVLRSPNRA